MAHNNAPKDSPEKAIRERARKLPLYKCYVNRDWEDSQMAHVIISRKHVNGNITCGFYLVDLLCLGLKDTFFYFNIPQREFEEQMTVFKDQGDADEIDYVTAHNIVYAGVEFAESLGFKPHKLFEISKFILEEDDDKIEMMEIECGQDGMPVVLVADDEPQSRTIAHLEKTLGRDNFLIYNVDEESEEEENDEDDSEGEEETEITDADIRRIKDILRKENPTAEDVEFLTEAVAPALFNNENLDESIPVVEYDNLDFGEDEEVTDADIENYEKLEAETKALPDNAACIDFLTEKYAATHDQSVASLLAKYLSLEKQTEKAAAVLQDAVECHPGNMNMLSTFLSFLLMGGMQEMAARFLNNRLSIAALFPEKKVFDEYAVMRLYCNLALFLAQKGEYDRAITYLYAVDPVREEYEPLPEWMMAVFTILPHKL
jgi:hypothetical protein